MRMITRGVSATAAVLLFTACGGGSETDDTASETTASPTSSAAETTSEAPAGDSEFCTQAEDFGTRISGSLAGGEDPAQVGQQLQQAADEIRTIDPPEEIADDWNALADGLGRVADAVAGASSNNDPEAAAQIQAELQELQTSATNVQTYLQQECGIDTGISESTSADEPSAAPSS